MDEPDPLDTIRGALAALTLEELRALREELAWHIAQLEQDEALIPLTAGREVVAVAREGRVTYRQELVKCGKASCRCAQGQLHGPYWYRYQRVGGRVVSAYVGKTLPAARPT
jgi:hypothetical protein